MLPFPTTDDKELLPIIQRVRVIEGLLKGTAHATASASHEVLKRIKEQQDIWVEELEMIDARLQEMARDRMMQVFVARLERGGVYDGYSPSVVLRM